MHPFRICSSLLIAGLALAAGCSSSDSAIAPTLPSSTLQLDASTAPVYLALGTTASVVSVGDPTTSSVWDLALSSEPAVAVNGGASGPGGVTAYCVCTNRGLTLAQIEAITPAAGADAFAAVTASSIPSAASFQADSVSLAISGWYAYNSTTHAITTNANVWGIRLASAAGNFAKFHVVSIPSPAQANAGPVTLEWALQTGTTGTLGANRSLVVDLSSGAKVYVNLTAGTSSPSSATPWDIALQGYSIYVNGGASGSGGAAAVPLVPSAFYNSYGVITAIPIGAQGIPPVAFAVDGAGGAFLSDEPYRYDPTAHQIWPTLDVYLVKRGTAVYKVQIIGYYGTNGAFGILTVRYEKLAD